ncbi:23S rRNA (guanosine(2251)-2'-O)-methyltransferase RlmB [uncultured Mobiluncus sp.]|uniref:23S rRNA (guanosine(2251)-2'-O)-methyltransferase RlmB n=1 Tax=uncultured Mobiluncus sp. TaxID=293425 RepID=UPI00288B7F3F|nr:23S rRNA (guanosine(2251)-2'-O)-methyltransferase RlmB [uncultured Mobiluncus sp.]
MVGMSPKKTTSHAPKGSGGVRRHRLKGKGPTPKAANRPYHQAYRDRLEAERKATHTSGVTQRAAAKDKYRPTTAADSEIIFGRNPVVEAAAAGVPLKRLFVSATLMKDERLSKVVQRGAASGAELQECSPADLDRITAGGTHQGIAAEIAAYEYAEVMDLWDQAVARAKSEPKRPPLFIVLDQVTDPHNLGATLRSAAAFGADGVIIGEHRSASVTAAVWKVSAGAAAIVPVAKARNLTHALQQLQAEGAFAIGLDGGGEVDLPALTLADQPLVVVTGSEGKGISRLVRETCDQIVSIPIDKRMESLNAAVATGIALYQIAALRG